MTRTVSARVSISSPTLFLSSLFTRSLTTAVQSLSLSLGTAHVVYRMPWREKRGSDVTLLSLSLSLSVRLSV